MKHRLRKRIRNQIENDEKGFAKWLNEWGDVYTIMEGEKITDFEKGYKQAIRDVIRKLGTMNINIEDYL